MTIPFRRGCERAAEPAPLAGGRVMRGRYELSHAIGQGAFGEVYAATRRADGASVAIKVLQRPDAAQLARFHEEARLLRRAQHRNVVQLLEVWGADSEPACLVMEQLSGPTLADRLEDGPLPISEVLELARDTLCAIDAFSARGIVHRDLKPGNLVSHPRGHGRWEWKVIDFGVAVGSSESNTPSRELVVGTPRYMAPEQLRGGIVDVRTDLFALGALLYEAITGASCYGRDSLVEVIAATLHDEVVPLRELRPDCPVAVERLVMRALEKDPERRAQSAAEMLDEVEALRAGSVRSRWSLAALWSWIGRLAAPRRSRPRIDETPCPGQLAPRSLADTEIRLATTRRCGWLEACAGQAA